MNIYDDWENEDTETVDECVRMSGLLWNVTPLMVYELWSDYSESMFAGWLSGLNTMGADEFMRLAHSLGRVGLVSA